MKKQFQPSLLLKVTWLVSADLGVKPRFVGLQSHAFPPLHGLSQLFQELMAASGSDRESASAPV